MQNFKTRRFFFENDRNIELVLNRRTAVMVARDSSFQVGDLSVLIFENEKKACVVETIRLDICAFKDINDDLVFETGENLTLSEWKNKYFKLFSLDDPTFDENTKITFESIRIVTDLVQERLDFAYKIAHHNSSVFGSFSSIMEINVGFNNSIFDVDNKFIIKVCGNVEDEQLFEVESRFYEVNKNNKCLPKFYLYDNSKKIIPYVYEILEKIEGKSVYYFWYRMEEEKRENLIKELMGIIKKFHLRVAPRYDWCNYVKSSIQQYFKLTMNLFSEEEREIIAKSFDKYEKILVDNRFALIHNDLHFDNILLDTEKNIKIIDFNDSMEAPIDYEFRIFYMCQKTPWKWANMEMDSYQKKEDYKNIFCYIKKYYGELNDILYLEERMVLYEILNDIRLFPHYPNEELRQKIVSNCSFINSCHFSS